MIRLEWVVFSHYIQENAFKNTLNDKFGVQFFVPLDNLESAWLELFLRFV